MTADSWREIPIAPVAASSGRMTRHSERAALAAIAHQLARERKQGILIVHMSSSGKPVFLAIKRPYTSRSFDPLSELHCG
jgi:hypothetical protein